MYSDFSVTIVQPVNHSANDQWSETLEELFLLKYNGTEEIINLHDYKKLYAIPGLYNHILNDTLKCTSQNVVAESLLNLYKSTNLSLTEARVLDFAAGSGLVAKAIYDRGGRVFVGVDIEREAKKAVERDFPYLYISYQLLNFCDLSPQEIHFFEEHKLNTLVAASALGFGEKHVPVGAFINAFNLIESGGRIVFCIYEQYLSSSDQTGYKQFLDKFSEKNFDLHENQRYVHRMTTYGTEIWYRVISGIKKSNIIL